MRMSCQREGSDENSEAGASVIDSDGNCLYRQTGAWSEESHRASPQNLRKQVKNSEKQVKIAICIR